VRRDDGACPFKAQGNTCPPGGLGKEKPSCGRFKSRRTSTPRCRERRRLLRLTIISHFPPNTSPRLSGFLSPLRTMFRLPGAPRCTNVVWTRGRTTRNEETVVINVFQKSADKNADVDNERTRRKRKRKIRIVFDGAKSISAPGRTKPADTTPVPSHVRIGINDEPNRNRRRVCGPTKKTLPRTSGLAKER